MSEGIATINPATVVSSAPATPGASAEKSDFPAAAMPQNASMTPQTVPNSPRNGLTLTIVARNPMRVSSSISCLETSLMRTASIALYCASDSRTGRVETPVVRLNVAGSLS